MMKFKTLCFIACFSVIIDGFLRPMIQKSTYSSNYQKSIRNELSPLSATAIDSFRNLRDKLETPVEEIIKAVEKIGPNVPISIGDAAAMSGLDLNTARSNLMTLATLTGGDLEVTEQGEILYAFPKNVRSVLQQRSLGQQVKTTYTALSPYLLFTLRASFGLALFTSLAILVGTFIAISSSSSGNSEDDRKRDRGGNSGMGGGLGRMNYNFGPSLFDVFYYRPYYGYYQTSGYRPDYSGAGVSSQPQQPEMNFIESFFSYVFGDGDPNAEFSKEQLRCISAMIRSNGGVVVAEQLAPYLDPPPLNTAMKVYDGTASSYDSTIVDESWVLPAVVQLGGVPTATADGNIVYQFQDLVTTATPENSFINRPLPPTLNEKESPFSAATAQNQFIAGGLGVLNLGGALWLGRILSSSVWMAREPTLLAGLSRIYPGLLVYAVLYNAIPALRWLLFTKKENANIVSRNSRRTQWANYLSSASSVIVNKIKSVRAEKSTNTVARNIGGASNVYSTKDSENSKIKDEQDYLKEFDKKNMM
mmetsp:Transcript_10488/g.10121  ORF Transcript_10488/g.10121 Transcript_10488/m.10121 type:complete len:532 (-) Transcript_10488:200-1795(-)